MAIIVYFIVYFQSLINLKFKPEYYLNTVIFSIFFLKFLVAKIDSAWAGASSPFILILVLTLIPALAINGIKKYTPVEYHLFLKTIITIILTITYFTLSALIRDISPQIYLEFIRDYFYYIIVFFFCISLPPTRKLLEITRFIFIMFVLQVLLGFLQYIGPFFFADFFKVISYQWNNGTTYLLSPFLWNSKLVLGTLLRPANFGNTLALLSVYFVGKALLSNEKFTSNSLMLLLTLLAIFVVLTTGIRTSAISLIIGLLLLLFNYNKRYFVLSLFSIIIITFIYYQLLIGIGSIAVSRAGSIENPFERLTGLINVFANIQYLDLGNSLTLGRSIVLFDDFFRDPLFGVGAYWKQGYYGMLYAGSSTASWSDAALMFHLVEFGIVGLGFLLAPYFYILAFAKKKLSKNDFKIQRTVFIVLLVQSITDQSIFSYMSSLIFIVLISIDLIEVKLKALSV